MFTVAIFLLRTQNHLNAQQVKHGILNSNEEQSNLHDSKSMKLQIPDIWFHIKVIQYKGIYARA